MDKVVIVGAGQAAIWAAKTLRDEGYESSITVIGDEVDAFYERPPLSKSILTNKDEYESLKIFSDEVVDGLNIELINPVKVTRIDRDNKTVFTDSNQEFQYEKLLIATGSKAKIPVEKWTNQANVYSLRNINDSKVLREKLKQAKEIAIIGAGWIGLEVAASLRSLDKNVTVYEINNRVCSRSVSPEVSEYIYDLHQQHGVNIQLANNSIEIVEHDDEHKVDIKTDTGTVTYDAVLLGAGAHINKEIAAESGIEVLDGVVVNEFCQTNDPDVYAAGDVAIHPLLGFCIQSWANAQNQGIIAAKSMLDKQEAYQDIPWLWSDQYDRNIQILGSPKNIEKTHLVIRSEPNDTTCFFYLDENNKLQYLVAINNNKAVKIAKRWMKADKTLDPNQLQDNSVNILKIK